MTALPMSSYAVNLGRMNNARDALQRAKQVFEYEEGQVLDALNGKRARFFYTGDDGQEHSFETLVFARDGRHHDRGWERYPFVQHVLDEGELVLCYSGGTAAFSRTYGEDKKPDFPIVQELVDNGAIFRPLSQYTRIEIVE